MNTDPWPWPGDSPLDRARRVARTYRDSLHSLDPALCATVDQRCRDLGQSWIVPKPLTYSADDQLTADEVADMCDVQPSTVRQWKRRGLPAADTVDGVRYLVADVLAYHSERRVRRASKTVNPDMTRNS